MHWFLWAMQQAFCYICSHCMWTRQVQILLGLELLLYMMTICVPFLRLCAIHGMHTQSFTCQYKTWQCDLEAMPES